MKILINHPFLTLLQYIFLLVHIYIQENSRKVGLDLVVLLFLVKIKYLTRIFLPTWYITLLPLLVYYMFSVYTYYLLLSARALGETIKIKFNFFFLTL